MKVQIEKLLYDARISMKQNPQQRAALINSDQLTLDLWIRTRLPAVVDSLHLSLYADAFDNPQSFSATIAWIDTLTFVGKVVLPADYLRLVSFKMTDWDIAVHEPIDASHPAFHCQSSPYAGIRGNPQRPVCTIHPDADGRALHFYSCSSIQAEIETALYMPRADIDQNDCIEIASACYHQAIEKLAADFTSK